ncbi:MAG TPA: Fic family protein [Thermoanaerobaculia bacterium]|jgi:Fic family protein|nr:Fic family protein [Thermoanaerobaculia bacterium]
MNESDFTAPAAGRIVRTNDGAPAFVPSPLPPELPLSWTMLDAITRAERAVANLRGVGATLPNPHLLIAPFARREAVLSSRIEGTQASVGDLVAFEAGSTPADSADVHEVANYVAALDYGLERLKEFPPSLRFIREVHERLMRGVRGGSSNPGEFRHLQNWIGAPGSRIENAKYVPPPVADMHKALDEFEKFLHAPSHLPSLIRFALIHYHFEAIHPFLDGNGRVGRLLITFLFHTEELLDHPLLYLSGFFERHRADYYRLLLGVSMHGEWEEWIAYFLTAVAEQATDAVRSANKLLALRQEYRNRTTSARSSALLGAMIDRLFQLPAITITAAARELDVTYRAAKMNVDKLVTAGILTEPATARNRVYMAREIIDLLEAP